MDAISLIRPLPQTPPPAPGAAPAAKPCSSSGKPDDAPAFAPAEQAPEPATDKGEPAATKEDGATQTSGKPSAASTLPQDQAATADRATIAAANGTALLIAQAAAAQNPPVATPVVAPVVITLPGQVPTPTKKQDPATAIGTVTDKPAPPSKPAAVASATAPQTSTATQPAPQPTTAVQPGAPEAAPAPSGGPSSASIPAPIAPQQDVAGGTAATADKPNALDTLLNAAKPQTTQSPSPAPQPQTQTAAQPAAPQAQPTAQVAQLAAADPNAPAVTSDQPDTDAPTPARAAADMSTAPAVSFGTDPGASAHVKTATAAYEAARAATPIQPASEQVAMQIHRAIEDGIDKLTVELKPASLGRVSAEIQFHDDHRVHVVLSADRPATLDALRSDSRALERALQDAGLRADAGSLSFRFENGGGQPGFRPDGSGDAIAVPTTPVMRDAAPLALTAYANMARPGGIDLRV